MTAHAEGSNSYTAFVGARRLVSGDLKAVLVRTKEEIDQGSREPILLFEDQSGRSIDFDFRGTRDEVLARYLAPAVAKPGPGRPRLGVVSREVSLLPRHWAWLEREPQGISAALRRLVDEARKREPDKQRARLAREAAGKFMWSIAGDLADFEEASRALYAKDGAKLRALVAPWPVDIRDHIVAMIEGCEQLEGGPPRA